MISVKALGSLVTTVCKHPTPRTHARTLAFVQLEIKFTHSRHFAPRRLVDDMPTPERASTFADAINALKAMDNAEDDDERRAARRPSPKVSRHKSSFAALLHDEDVDVKRGARLDGYTATADGGAKRPARSTPHAESTARPAAAAATTTTTTSETRGALALWAPDDAKRRGCSMSIPARHAEHLSARQVKVVRYLHRMYSVNEGCVLVDEAEAEPIRAACCFASAALANRCAANKTTNGVLLVLCSPNAIMAWVETLCLFGLQDSDVAFARGSKAAEDAFARALVGGCSVVVLTHDTFKKVLDNALTVPWLMVIYDEVHRLKNSSRSKQYEAASALHRKCFRIGLSDEILENCDEIESWHVLNWANPWSMGDKKFFQEYFLTPIADGHKGIRKDLARDRVQQLTAHLKKAFFSSEHEFSEQELFATNAPDIGGKDDDPRTALFALESLAKFEKVSVEEMAQKLLTMDKKSRDALRWRVIADSEYGSFASSLAEWKRQNNIRD